MLISITEKITTIKRSKNSTTIAITVLFYHLELNKIHFKMT